jgi:hypothetical protein
MRRQLILAKTYARHAAGNAFGELLLVPAADRSAELHDAIGHARRDWHTAERRRSVQLGTDVCGHDRIRPPYRHDADAIDDRPYTTRDGRD